MRRHRTRPVSLAAVIAALVMGGSLLLAAGCGQPAEETPVVQPSVVPEAPATGEGLLGPANDWVVIHAARKSSSSEPSGPVDTCAQTAEGELAWLPACLGIREGHWIGFANLYRDDTGGQTVTVNLPPGIFEAENDELKLSYGEVRIVKVKATPTEPSELKFVLVTAPTAGPIMIPVDDRTMLPGDDE